MSIIVLPETLEAWKEERKYGIGASDAGAMLGMSNWKSNEELWLEKTGLREPEDISGKPFVQYGHDAEPHLRALFSLSLPLHPPPGRRQVRRRNETAEVRRGDQGIP